MTWDDDNVMGDNDGGQREQQGLVTLVMSTLWPWQSDIGGDKVLQKKWTTFLKAQLVCSQPGHFPFNVINHAFALLRQDGRADFYAVFTSQW